MRRSFRELAYGTSKCHFGDEEEMCYEGVNIAEAGEKKGGGFKEINKLRAGYVQGSRTATESADGCRPMNLS